MARYAYPPEGFVHGLNGPVVVVPGRVAALLVARAGLSDFHVQHRGLDAEVDAAHAPDADAEVRTRMAAAVAAAITYIRAAQDRATYLQALAVRAQTLGFRVDVAQPPNPLPPLGQAILAEATANHGVRASSVWTT